MAKPLEVCGKHIINTELCMGSMCVPRFIPPPPDARSSPTFCPGPFHRQQLVRRIRVDELRHRQRLVDRAAQRGAEAAAPLLRHEDALAAEMLPGQSGGLLNGGGQE